MLAFYPREEKSFSVTDVGVLVTLTNVFVLNFKTILKHGIVIFNRSVYLNLCTGEIKLNANTSVVVCFRNVYV